MKAQRWYRIEGDRLAVYDQPHADRAGSVSLVPLSEMAYYRANFILRKCWKIIDGGK